MSAYQISPEHACQIVTAFLELRGARSSITAEVRDEADVLVQELLTECSRSVAYLDYARGGLERYEPTSQTRFIAAVRFAPCPWAAPFAFHRARTLARVIVACDHYAYQACEHPAWKDPECKARKLVEDCKDMAAAALGRFLAGSSRGADGIDYFYADHGAD